MKVIQFKGQKGWEDVSNYEDNESDELIQHDFNEYMLSNTGLYRIIKRKEKTNDKC